MVVLGCLGLLLLFAVVFNVQTVLAGVRRLTHRLTRGAPAQGRHTRKVARGHLTYALRKAHANR